MTVSQNGYPAGNPALLATGVTIPGTDVHFPSGVRDGAVTVVLMYVAAQLHRRVQPADVVGCWGYANRPIRGSATVSNHASGTAIDYNAPRHPLGTRGTWSAAERDTVHAILREVDNVVRWGDDYTGRVDGMHFEINAPLAAVERVAARLATGAGDGTLRKGATGAAVTRLQTLLDQRLATGPVPAVDGVYGDQTADAVRRFGDQVGIANPANNGEYGPRTRFYLDPPDLRRGASGPHVTRLQHALNVRANANLALDGEFGPATEQAVRSYQRSRGFDFGALQGTVGPATWTALIKGT